MSKPRGDFSTPVLTVEFTTEMNTRFEKESSSAFCCVALLLPSSSETRRWVNFLHFGAGELTLKLDDGVAGEQGEASMRRRYNWHLSEQKEERKGGERQRHRGEERREGTVSKISPCDRCHFIRAVGRFGRFVDNDDDVAQLLRRNDSGLKLH